MNSSPLLARWLLVLRSLVPAATLLLAVALVGLPYGIPYLSTVTPFFALIVVYYWSIHRPEQLPAAAIFAAGVLQDLITGGPPGSVALLLLLAHALVVSQRRILLGQSYLVEWAGLLLVAVGAGVVGWLVACVYNTALFVPWHFLVQALLSVALYPITTWALAPAARAARAAEPA
ncbi:MAG: rod shape-determining protein MreD [Alphaproteobacteria bacterium]|nr:rod shape-determining protein MreD [Alphaproteobacteria bacterium]